jgi:hypothetical protein
MKLFSFIILLFLTSCTTTSPLPKPEHRTPSKSAKVYKPNTWNINSKDSLDAAVQQLNGKVYIQGDVLVFDMKGGIIDGSKQKGDGSQNENQEPLFRANVPFVLRNGFIRNNKNAATFAESNSGIDSVTFLNVGEDAVATSRGARNFQVTNCEFLNDRNGDKSVQLNQAAGAVIADNMIFGGITGVRVHESSWSNKDTIAYCEGNTFIGTDTAWNVSKGILQIKGKNEYKHVRIPFKTSKGGSIKNPDGKVVNE